MLNWHYNYESKKKFNSIHNLYDGIRDIYWKITIDSKLLNQLFSLSPEARIKYFYYIIQNSKGFGISNIDDFYFLNEKHVNCIFLYQNFKNYDDQSLVCCLYIDKEIAYYEPRYDYKLKAMLLCESLEEAKSIADNYFDSANQASMFTKVSEISDRNSLSQLVTIQQNSRIIPLYPLNNKKRTPEISNIYALFNISQYTKENSKYFIEANNNEYNFENLN